jgi:DNA-directed RNA polymerase specialized sigma24 family protein
MAVRADEIPKHRILREVYRHYLTFQDLITSPEHDGQGGYNTSDGVIEHGYFVEPEAEDEETGKKVKTGERYKVLITLSFWDLQGALKALSPRKREAVFYNVIMDYKQKDVAAIMDITTVSVGQYVEQGMIQLAEEYFADMGIRIIEQEPVAA